MLVYGKNTGSSSYSKAFSWFDKFSSSLNENLIKLKAKVLGKKLCHYRKSPAKYVKQRLADFLRCQDTAVSSIHSAVRAWDFELKNKNERHEKQRKDFSLLSNIFKSTDLSQQHGMGNILLLYII